MHNIVTISRLIEKVSYKQGKFLVLEKGDGFLIQYVFHGRDIDTGKYEIQKCRKWYISPHACDSEIVRTCFLAVKQAEEHELCENFKYKGQQVYNPHLDLDAIAEFMFLNKPLQKRQETNLKTES